MSLGAVVITNHGELSAESPEGTRRRHKVVLRKSRIGEEALQETHCGIAEEHFGITKPADNSRKASNG